MWLVLFNPQSKGQQQNGPQSTQAETQHSLNNIHVQLSLRPVSNFLLIALFLITLPEVATLYLAGDRKSPVFYQVYLSIAVLAIIALVKILGIQDYASRVPINSLNVNAKYFKYNME